jgi:hypothetical protein
MSTGLDLAQAQASHLLDPRFEALGARLLTHRKRHGALVFVLAYLRWRLLIELSPLGGSDTDVVVAASLTPRQFGLRSKRIVETVIGPFRERRDLRSALLLMRGELRRRDDVAVELARRAW